MKYKNFNDLDLDFSTNLITWNGEVFSGIAFEILPGDFTEETMIVGGMKNGSCKRWFPSGRLQMEEHYSNNSKHGISWVWFEEGKLHKEAVYEFSIKLREKEWNLDGKLIRDYKIDTSSGNYDTLVTLRERYRFRN
ncbi:MAG: hypothetical protein AAFQ83_24580 [Bacteroidota bacterium]